jgi:quercetin dioxygenase-like cupin family protein
MNISRSEVLKAVISLTADIPVVFATGYTCRQAHRLADRPNHFYMTGSMGMASAIGMGMASTSQAPVVVVDGDGALLMNLSTLLLTSQFPTRGFVHLPNASISGRTVAVKIVRAHDNSHAGPAQWFTGRVWFEKVTMGSEPRLSVMKVRFSPGARTAWHTHPVGQILHVIDGTGLIAERGGHATQIHAGDFALTEAGVWHWHGATPHTFMTHLAIHQTDHNDIEYIWGDHVAETEYLIESDPDRIAESPPSRRGAEVGCGDG